MFKKSYIPRIALRDITTYKVVYKTSTFKKETFCTPYRDCLVRLNQTYTGEFIRPFGFLKSLFEECLEDGFIHSCSKIDRAIIFKCRLNSETLHYNEVVECIIPKGTIYFIGKYNDIASRKLKYIKII